MHYSWFCIYLNAIDASYFTYVAVRNASCRFVECVFALPSLMPSYFRFTRFYYLNFTVDELSGGFIAYFYGRKTDFLLQILDLSGRFQARYVTIFEIHVFSCLFHFCVYQPNHAIKNTVVRFRTSTSLSEVFGCQITRTNNLYIYVRGQIRAYSVSIYTITCEIAQTLFSSLAARSPLTIHKRAALFTQSFCPNHTLARTNNAKRIIKRYGFYGPFSFTGSKRSLECRISHPQKCESIIIRYAKLSKHLVEVWNVLGAKY